MSLGERRPACVGLHGGLGNCIFVLPAIKALSRKLPIILYVQGDYCGPGGMPDLFRRCTYARQVIAHPEEVPSSRAGIQKYVCGQYAPTKNVHGWRRMGWAPGESTYPWPEWEQVKRRCTGNSEREDVSDWIDVRRTGIFDFGLIPGCKASGEWARKKWSGFAALAEALPGTVKSFGQEDEIREAKLESYWDGHVDLVELPDRLAQCRVIIGTDSGVLHLASSIGLPCVSIFTATSPVKGDPVGDPRMNRKIWRGLECSPCQSTKRWQQCNDWRCRDILLEEVLGAALGLASPRTLPVLR